MDITESDAIRARFAETYSREDYAHPLRQFEQYDVVMACREETGAGGRKLSDWTDVPYGRVQGWIYDDSAPIGYRSSQWADSLGLFDLDWEGEQFQGLNELVAWVFSGGTVSMDRYVPLFHVDTPHLDVCTAAVERAGAPDYAVESTPGGGDTKSVRITDAGSVFGRLLVALGAPRGNKHESSQRFGLPCYLGAAPELVRRRFAEIYLLNRAGTAADRNSMFVHEERPDAYLEGLAGLFRSLTDAEVWRDSGGGIYLSESGLDDIDIPKMDYNG